jgi:LysR family transcriptional regulator, cell division regulator
VLPSASEIQYFLEVSETLNISRAAERLGISQPTLSLSVQRLEQNLGTPLLIRGKSGVRLTKAGTRFALQSRALLEHWERLRSDSVAEETEVKGRITIGCHSSVALYSLPNFAPSLMAKYPDLELVFQHDLSRKVTERVVSFECDFGIVVNPYAHPELRIVRLALDEVAFWRAYGDFASDVLICEPDLLQTQSLLSQMKKSGPSPGFNFRRTIKSSSLEVVAGLAAAGAGVAILPTRVAEMQRDRKGEPKLKPFSAKAPIFEDKICLVYRPDAQKSVAAKVVMRAIEAGFKKTVA